MKKFLALAACLMLLGTITVSGTFAFSFDDLLHSLTEIFKTDPETDPTKLDVDTLIQVRSGNTMVPASENEVLIPAVYADSFDWAATATDSINGYNCLLWPKNSVGGAVEKFISVKNSSPDKAVYFRTSISIHRDVYPLLNINLNQTGAFDWTGWKADGKYMTNVATYKTKLAAKEISPPMMYQIALRKDVTNGQLAAFSTETEIIKADTLAIEADAFVNSDKEPMSDEDALKLLKGIQ